MTAQLHAISDLYTRKVGGETYQYNAQYSSGDHAEWSASIYLNGELKGTPCGMLAGNTLSGDNLRQYVIAYIEGLIERGLGVAE